MNRSQLLEAMIELHLARMRKSYDEITAAALKCGHDPQRIFGDLLAAETGEEMMMITKLPLSNELDEFAFDAGQVEEALVRNLASGDALNRDRQEVSRGRFFNVVNLVNRLVAETKADRPCDVFGWQTDLGPGSAVA